MTDHESVWCVHIQGPDDVLDAQDRLDAMRQAHSLNALSVTAIEGAGDDPYYPTMWAVPIRRSDLYSNTEAV